MQAQATNNSVVHQRIDDWRRRLIDLSHRNRLIAYKPTKATTLEIVGPVLPELLADPDRTGAWRFFLPPEPTDGDESDTTEAREAVEAVSVWAEASGASRGPNEIEVTERSPKRIARILDNLARRANTEFQDKALRILYVAAGFLDWHDQQREKAITSPLVLVPVELRRASARDPYGLFFLEDEDIVINPSLTEKLRRDAGLDIPSDWAWEDKPILQELAEIREAVASTPWTVREDAAIGLFSFQKYVMYRDLLDNEATVAAHPLLRSLAQGQLTTELRDADPEVPEPAELDEAQHPQEALSILDSDASQRQCVEAAKRGRSFVMQGPPGTGKSQTIANVIAESIGQGKRILFVSEKAAALDVVHKRLTSSGLDEYCLMLHGEHAARREVVQALDRSLTTSLRAGMGMRGDELERLANIRTLLNDSAELLHLPQPLLGARSVREVHEQLAGLHAAPSAPGAPDASKIDGQAVLDDHYALAEAFERLVERWHVSPSDFAWRDFVANRFTADDHGTVLVMLRRLEENVNSLDDLSTFVGRAMEVDVPTSLVAARRLAGLGEHLASAPALEEHWLDLDPTELERANGEGREAYQASAALRETYAEEFPGRDLEEFPPHTGRHLLETERAARQAAGWAPAWDHGLHELPRCLNALHDLPRLVDEATTQAHECAGYLGQPTVGLTEHRLAENVDLAELSFQAEDRPPDQWLVTAGLQRAKNVLEEVAGDLRSYQARRTKLLESYSEDVLDLDAEGTRNRFVGQYTSIFSKLSGSYRQDARAVKSVRQDGKVPATIADDLAVIIQAQLAGAKLDAASQRMDAALGSYAAGRLTDVDRVSAALRVAERAVSLSRADADLETLGRAIGAGSQSNPAIAQAADKLRATTAALSGSLSIVEQFVEHPAKLFAGSLSELSTTLRELSEPLREFADLVLGLDAGARAAAQGISETRWRAELIDTLHTSERGIRNSRAGWERVIGRPFAGPETDWDAVDGAAAWLRRLADLTDRSISPAIRTTLMATDKDWPDVGALRLACERVDTEGHNLSSRFEDARSHELQELVQRGRFEDVKAAVHRLTTSVDELHDWTEWRGWRERAQQQGWGRFLESLVEARVHSNEVIPAFQRAYWNRQLEGLFEADPELGQDLRGGAFQRWVNEFSDLDEKLVRTGADRLIARRENSRTGHVAMPGSEVDLLRREARKKRRHLPVRVLLSRIPGLLSELKPCLMMSPLTVSHFLAPEQTFDLIVFDEASQVPPQDAVNCIYRGTQLVVAGDSKQLPPTPFFQVAELDELSPDEEDSRSEEDMESILDSCGALLPSHSLRWHYRSRSEPLIAFSNRHIYDDSLVTFPSPRGASAQRGVAFTYVPDGQYDRGRSASNRREAQVVANRVERYLTDGTGRSVGVIAFNTAQANAIAEELDALRVREPSLEERFRGDRLDAVFVKHLEGVQGDERDVIVFSVGYGPDSEGRFLMNFGPLNKDGGERRLNVAITRAREKVDLVSSVRARDFSLSDGASAGARLLQEYVAYAEAGGAMTTLDAASLNGREMDEWPSPFEGDVAEVIQALGFDAVPNVGLGSFRIDIGARARVEPADFVLAIECDGSGYAQTPTARDRERLRHEVLAALGWGRVHRIWSLDWVRNRTAEAQRLKEALEAAVARRAEGLEPEPTNEDPVVDENEEAPRERVELVVHELERSAAAIDLPWTTPYQRHALRRHSSYYEFHETVNRREQTDMLVELLRVEAPVSIDYAIRRLADAWGLRRTGHRITAAGRQAVSQAKRRGGVQIRGEFLWLEGQTLTQVRVPDPSDPLTRRDVEDIPPEEIDLTLVRLLEASAGAGGEQLISLAARVLGFDRTGGRIQTVLSKRLTTLYRN